MYQTKIEYAYRCQLCFGLFRDPVLLNNGNNNHRSCGHGPFCYECIAQARRASLLRLATIV